MRNGIESLGLFRAIDARGEAAMTDNELALTYLALGNLAAADRHALAARQQLERLDDPFRLANVGDTQARIALARGDVKAAASSAAGAARLAQRTSNIKGEVDALLTVARIARRQGRTTDAVAALERAADLAAGAPPARLRQVLTEWSEIAAEAGDHAAAYELTRRALALG